MNPLLMVDGYKPSHRTMYPKGTTVIYSNFTPRSGKHSNVPDSKGVVVFGPQYVSRYIKEVFDEYFFKKISFRTRERIEEIDNPKHGESIGLNSLLVHIKYEVISEIEQHYSTYYGTEFDIKPFQELWDLGYLPIEIKALPEGTFCPYGVPALTIKNTDPKFFWLTNFLETLISNLLWMPMTSATTAFAYKKLLTRYCKETNPEAIDFVDFQAHDFSMRGMAGIDAAIMSGLGNCTSFKGSDTMPVIHGAYKYYDAEGFIIGSVPATEHSVMCAGGKQDEIETFRHLMNKFPTGILSIVSDTWDLWKVLTEYLPTLKDEIISRDGKIVIRPDSGDPVDIICGISYETVKDKWEDSDFNITKRLDTNKFYKTYTFTDYKGDEYTSYEELEKQPNNKELKGVIELLWDTFGGTINEQGYKVLDPHIGAIYGDSITLQRAGEICKRLKDKGFASTNIVLGIGSYTYQMVTRDTHGFAMKATYCEVEEEFTDQDRRGKLWTNTKVVGREIFKDPITDDGTKKSAKGLLQVFNNNPNCSGGEILYDGKDEFKLNDQVTWEQEKGGLLQTIFKDGELLNQTTLEEIRSRINKMV